MKPGRIVVAMVALVITTLMGAGAAQAAGLADSPWPMFQGSAQHTGRSTSTGPSSPALKWLVNVEGMPGSPAIGADGTIYVGSMNTDLYAVNPDGSVKWAVSPTASSITASPAIGPDGTIYCIDAASTLVAMNPDGTAEWFLELGESTGGDGSPSVGADGTVYVISGDSDLYAISPAGTVKWTRRIGDACVSTPALAADGTICINDDGLYSLSRSGAVRWRHRPDTLFSSVSPVIARDGTIYWRESWTFFAVTRGATKWRLSLPAPASSGLDPSPALGTDGTLYVPAPDVFAAGNQTMRAYFTRAACSVSLKLSGLTNGGLKLGKRVTATGTVKPAAAAVTLTVQRRVGTTWVRVKTAVGKVDGAGGYSWGYKPGRRGAYRVRANVAQTPTTKAATSPWRNFVVR